MGILLCEQNFRDVWRRNKSVGQKFVKICAHTHAAKLVVRVAPTLEQCVWVSQLLCNNGPTLTDNMFISIGNIEPSLEQTK